MVLKDSIGNLRKICEQGAVTEERVQGQRED